MPSSALSGNTSGLATDTSPGLVGTGAQTFAGKKTLDGGALIKGDTSGTAVAAGYVGELFGTLRSGTGGFTYSTRSTTSVPTTTQSSVISLTLNKGVYLISYKIKCASSLTANLEVSFYIGGTQVDATNGDGYVSPSYYGSVSNITPITISSDSTSVAVYAAVSSGTSLGNSHELWAVRIA